MKGFCCNSPSYLFLIGVLACHQMGIHQPTYGIEPPITALAFDPSGHQLLAGSQAGLAVYTWPALNRTNSLRTNLNHIHDLQFSPDQKLLAIAGGTPSEQGILKLYLWPNFQQLATYAIHSDLIYSIDFSADSKWIFTASHDGELLQLDAKTGKIHRRFQGHSQPVRTVCVLADQQFLVSAGHDSTLRVWNIKTLKQIRSLNNHTKPVIQMKQRPTLKDSPLPLFASIGEDRTIRLWQPSIGRMVRFLRLSKSTPKALIWSRDGRSLFIADQTGTLTGINPDTLELSGTVETTIRQPNCLALSPDEKHIILGGENGQVQKVDASRLTSASN